MSFLDGLWCTKGDSELARAHVATMNATFAALPPASKARFVGQVDAINASWKNYDGAWVFYTDCQAKEVGDAAADLNNLMAPAAGTALIAPNDPHLFDPLMATLNSVGKALGYIVVGGATLWALVKVAEAAGFGGGLRHRGGLLGAARIVRSDPPFGVRRRRRRRLH